jgi:hypothetical protein
MIRPQIRWVTLFVLLVGGASARASSTYIEYQAGPATASSTPGDVWSPDLWGWTTLDLNGATGSAGGVVNDANSGMNAWRVTDSVLALPNPAYVTEIFDRYMPDVRQYGWRYSATARLVSDYGGGPDMGLAAYLNGRVYHLMMDLSTSGALQATLSDDQTTRTYQLTAPGAAATAYHHFQLQSAPASSVVSFMFDGQVIDNAWDGMPFSHANTVQWGADNQGGALARGEMNFRNVLFDIGPFTPGDFNGDGLADGRDLLYWQRTVGSQLDNSADANGDGVVDATDLAMWRQNFGRTFTLAASANVPEPAAMFVALVVSLPWLGGALRSG